MKSKNKFQRRCVMSRPEQERYQNLILLLRNKKLDELRDVNGQIER